jgi:hypothetical protein
MRQSAIALLAIVLYWKRNAPAPLDDDSPEEPACIQRYYLSCETRFLNTETAGEVELRIAIARTAKKKTSSVVMASPPLPQSRGTADRIREVLGC